MRGSKLFTTVLLCLSLLTVSASAKYKVEIETVPQANFGQSIVVDVSIEPEGTATDLGGFELWVSYDPGKLEYVSTQQGDLLTDCAWEMFQAGLEPGTFLPCCVDCDNVKLVQFVSIADMNNGTPHPSCYAPTVKTSLAKITFQVTSEEEVFTPIYFYWRTGEECSDNSFSNQLGTASLIGDGVYDNGLFNCSGPDPSCENPPGAVADIDFYGGGVYLAGSFRGDVNRNDIPYDLGDYMVFEQYFFSGLSAFRINIAEQIAATDVNCDGSPLTMADLILLQRIIAEIQAPPSCGE
ncbi:MAG: cohesin domain-containing protein [bacterium]